MKSKIQDYTDEDLLVSIDGDWFLTDKALEITIFVLNLINLEYKNMESMYSSDASVERAFIEGAVDVMRNYRDILNREVLDG